jgi:DNA-directed RNA polymerase subunit RPC12/RpoP
MSDEPQLNCSECGVRVLLSEPGVAISDENEPRYLCPECARSVTFNPDSEDTGEKQWPPEFKLYRSKGGLIWTWPSHAAAEEAETYLPLHRIREQLLASEAIDAVAEYMVKDAGWRDLDEATKAQDEINGSIGDLFRQDAAACLAAAFTAAFPAEEEQDRGEG